jgi:hypothetical protein
MRTLTASIGTEGAVLDVQVGLAAADLQLLRNAGCPVPTPMAARALIDTGAEVSCVDVQLLDPLRAVGVAPQRFVFANFPAAGGLTLAPEYAVGLTIVHPSGNPRAALILRSLPVVEKLLDHLGYQVLLGRDVLMDCLLVYDGPAAVLTLAY